MGNFFLSPLSPFFYSFLCGENLNEKEMNIQVLTPEDIRKILNEELDRRFGPITATQKQPNMESVREGDDELIGTKEACRILGCCPKTIQTYRDRKLFRVVMRGPKKALYYRSDILRFRDANTRASRDKNHN